MALLEELATMKLLPDATQPIDPRMIIFHTMVGTLRGTDDFFRNSSAKESHFGVGGRADGELDGAIWQWVDTTQKAEANFNANAFAISIETSDGGDPSQPWSPRQLDALIQLTERLCVVHGIPPRVVSAWDDPVGGLGWHVMFGAPSHWTPNAKTCPGSVRIAQLQTVVFPALGVRDFAPGLPQAAKDDMLVYLAGGSARLLHGGKSLRLSLPRDAELLQDAGMPHAGVASMSFHNLFTHSD